ncbi:MAG: hypothetical protein IH794_08215 [Acidobacteria bacterium]|nr:hypothetical protein [Acidobacteriota bacterium]
MMIRIAQHPALLVFLFTLVSIRGAVFQESEAAPPSQAEAEVEDTDSTGGTQQSPTSTTNSGTQAGARQRGLIEDVSVSDVKTFLDPTRMINRLEYAFQANFLPNDARLFTNKFRPWYALNNSSAVWVRVPLHDFSIPNQDIPVGIGDIDIGGGFVIHEDLSRRLTSIAVAAEIRLPTGDVSKGTGLDAYIIAPAALLALNPTDAFPVYIVGRYLHSWGSLGGADTGDGTQEDPRLRSIQLEIRTFHILPKGVFLAVLPTFVFNLNQDFNIFSLGLGAGRALNRRFLIQGGYVQHIAGRETFNRALQIGITYLWGKDKSKP